MLLSDTVKLEHDVCLHLLALTWFGCFRVSKKGLPAFALN